MTPRDLASNAALIDPAAQLLLDTFRGKTADWQDQDSARAEVLASLAPDRVSRVMVDTSGTIVGWIGAIVSYGGRVWEIHPLVVRASHRRRGIGRALVADLERLALGRGALTLWAGSDDENDETTLSGTELYADIPGALQTIRNLRDHPYEFYVRVGCSIAGVLPDAKGRGKPDIFLAKRVGDEMPFKSQAQRRTFAQLLVEGKISPQTFEEWNRETGGTRLPDHVKRKTSKKKTAKRKRASPKKRASRKTRK